MLGFILLLVWQTWFQRIIILPTNPFSFFSQLIKNGGWGSTTQTSQLGSQSQYFCQRIVHSFINRHQKTWAIISSQKYGPLVNYFIDLDFNPRINLNNKGFLLKEARLKSNIAQHYSYWFISIKKYSTKGVTNF